MLSLIGSNNNNTNNNSSSNKDLESSKELESALQELQNRLRASNILDESDLNRIPFLTRYLKLNLNNVEKAERQLENYAKYIKDTDVKALEKWTAPQDEIVFNCIFGAVDHDGNPVIQAPYGCRYDIASFMDKGLENLFVSCADKLHWHLEKKLRDSNSEAGTLIINLKGVSYKQYLNKKTFKASVDYIRHILNMSPGALERVIIVNAPKIVKVLVQTVRKIMPFPTDVVVFSEQDSDWQKRLMDYVPADQLVPEFGGTFKNGYYML